MKLNRPNPPFEFGWKYLDKNGDVFEAYYISSEGDYYFHRGKELCCYVLVDGKLVPERYWEEEYEPGYTEIVEQLNPHDFPEYYI